MENNLHTLAYFSRNAIEESGGNLEIEIGQILSTARDRNQLAGVTGALMFSSGCFGQVLEGPLQEIEVIFESILRDPRHRDITVLSLKPLDSRRFADWSMGFAGLPKPGEVPLEIDRLLNSPNEIQSGPAEVDFISVLSSLIARHEIH